MADTHRVDRTDRHFQFQSPYEGGRGQGQYEGDRGYGGGGYKSMMPESGPSSTQVMSLSLYLYILLIFIHTKLRNDSLRINGVYVHGILKYMFK